MQIAFHKYHGAGNDFILLDDRGGRLAPLLTKPVIASLCARHFGIGADGLMLLGAAEGDYDFEMIYFNSDGAPSTMCGNGGRCIVRFAYDLGIEKKNYQFLAVDGPHQACFTDSDQVALGMNDVTDIQVSDGALILDTGSPHYLQFVDSLEEIDVRSSGRSIRNSPPFREKGINVNFVVDEGGSLSIATYERGVEDETLACGTGVTAAVVGALQRRGIHEGERFRIPVTAKGGKLAVSGTYENGRYFDLSLIGPAEFVFSGTIEINTH